MKINVASLKILTALLVASALAACSTTGLESNEPWQGKVWRGKIQRQFVDTSVKSNLSEEVAKKAHFSAEHTTNMRMAQVVAFRGGFLGNVTYAMALVPDNVEFDDIKKGAVVDFIFEPGITTNFSTYRLNRIVRLVCRSDDDACIDREKSAHRLNSIIDDNPGDDFRKYGLTYNRRNSPEDIKKYK
jgi:hypothetical protein